MSLKDQILFAEEKPTAVHVPEWNVTVYVQVMSGVDRDAWEAAVYSHGEVNRKNFRATLLVKSLVDDTGIRIFADDDAEKLGEKSGKVIADLFEVAQKVNGLTKKDVEVLAKN